MCKPNTVKVSLNFDAKGFDAMALKEKAVYLMALKQAEADVKNALAEVKDVFEQDFNDSRNDITETVQITTEYGVVELPSGYKEKTLKDGEVEDFVTALKKLDKKAYDVAVEMVPKISKVELNKLRKEVGPMKTLIDDTYKTADAKPVIYTLSKTI